MRWFVAIVFVVAAAANSQVAYFPMDGSALDAGPIGLDGTGGSISWIDDRSGNPASAALFGGGSPMRVDGIPNITGSISLCAWIRPDEVNPPAKMGIMGKGGFTLRNNGLFITPDSRLRFSLDGVSSSAYSRTFLQEGEWHAVAAVYRLDQSLELYIDGELDTLVAATGTPLASPVPFAIGCQGATTCSQEAVSYIGAVDEVRIFDFALDQEQIRECAYPRGLVACYPLDGVTLDASGNGLHLTNLGATPVTDRHGVANGAFGFSGGDVLLADHYSPVDSQFSIQGSMTLAAWIKPSIVNPNRKMGIMGKGNAAQRNYGLFVNPDGRLRFGLDGVDTILVGQSVLVPNTWSFVCAVYSLDSGVSLYLNGQLDAWAPALGLPIYSGTQFTLGCQGEDQCSNNAVPFSGSIDDVFLFARALNPQEVQGLFQPGQPPELAIIHSEGTLILSWGDAPGYSRYLIQHRVSQDLPWTNVATSTGHVHVLPVDGQLGFFRVIGSHFIDE